MTDNETTTAETTPQPAVAGLLAEFSSAEVLRAAAEGVRDEGYSRWDVHSPFPVHGIERAMGMRPTVLPWVVLGAGLFGAAAALFLQWWTNATSFDTSLPNALRGYDWKVSGKPAFSLPANVPIIFEIVILFSALAAFGGVFALCRLPRYAHPVFTSRRFGRATTDRFFIAIDAEDPKFDEAATGRLLESLGATAVETCREPAAGHRVPWGVRWGVITLVVLALVPLALAAQYRSMTKRRPRIHPVQDMDFQPKAKAQAASPLFADGRAARPPVAGTVARDALRDDEHFYQGYTMKKVDGEVAEKSEEMVKDFFDTFPEQVTISRAAALRGQARYEIYCATCHGLSGAGDGMTAARALERRDRDWATPVSFHTPDVRGQPVGQIYDTITNGIRKMPGYAAQIPPDDRWAIVLYVRALQRSRFATMDDVPADVRPQLR